MDRSGYPLVYPANLARLRHSHLCNGHSVVIAAEITIQLKAGRSSLAYVSREIEHARLVHPLFLLVKPHPRSTPRHPSTSLSPSVSLLLFSPFIGRCSLLLLAGSSFVTSNTREQGSSRVVDRIVVRAEECSSFVSSENPYRVRVVDIIPSPFLVYVQPPPTSLDGLSPPHRSRGSCGLGKRRPFRVLSRLSAG